MGWSAKYLYRQLFKSYTRRTSNSPQLAAVLSPTSSPPICKSFDDGNPLILVSTTSNSTIFLETHHSSQSVQFLDGMDRRFPDDEDQSRKLILVGTGLQDL
jgi:hypothetical protein